jgi:uncharacterized protein YpiB (UPF0302 family)
MLKDTYTDITKQAQLESRMAIGSMFYKEELNTLRKRIDESLRLRNKDLFMRLTREYNIMLMEA